MKRNGEGIGKGLRYSICKMEAIVFWTIGMSEQEMIIRGVREARIGF